MDKNNFKYYEPINEKQKQFHKSKAMHKLLIGGYRGGKTYPAIHEAIFMCFDQPEGSYFAVFRNTWDSLADNIEKDMVKILEDANALAKPFVKTDHKAVLWNGVTILFRPLTLSRKQLKGMNLFGFLIDDPDETKYADIISFLFTRLTNPPGVKANYFGSIICANYEGHGWLWKTYIKNKQEGGDGTFAYWVLKTTDNPTLHNGYVETLEAVHSKAWMDRYVHGKLDSYTGLIYNEYDPNKHDMNCHDWCVMNKDLVKITATDVGITHPSVILKVATDYKNIYIYDELYKTNMRTTELGYKTVKIRESDKFIDHVIDPSSAKREQTSGKSVKQDLWERFKLRYTGAENSKNRGIEFVKNILTPRNKEGVIDIENGKPNLYIDPVYCPNTIREIEMYKWKEPEMTDFDELAFKEEPVKKDDDCMDAMKYACMRLRRYLRSLQFVNELLKDGREELWKQRKTKLKMYREMNTGHPDVFGAINRMAVQQRRRQERLKKRWERLSIRE
jgi:hypothetical protein